MLPKKAADQARDNREQSRPSRDQTGRDARDEIATAISAVDDPDARRALGMMFEALFLDGSDGGWQSVNRGNSEQ